MNSIRAVDFFDGEVPKGLPEDCPVPDYDNLASKVVSMDSGGYPVKEVREIILSEHTKLGALRKCLETIDSITPDSVFVVAGQQAGLFGGHLYTTYKALHSIRLAERLSTDTGKNVIPIFWIASDDHDSDEVSHIGKMSNDETSAEFMEYLPENHKKGSPVGEIILDRKITQVIESFSTGFSPGEKGDRYRDLLERCWTEGRKWTEAFCLQMLGMFGDFGLVMLDPRWKGVKELFSPVYRKELENPLASTTILDSQASLMPPSERRKAIRRPPGSTNLFIQLEGKRETVFSSGEGFHAGGIQFTREEMILKVMEEPYLFSPAAALRPICQDSILPVAALISGPGEKRYLEQAAPLYDLFGVERSIVWPRASFTVIDPRTARNANKENIPLNKLFSPVEAVISELAGARIPEDFEKALRNAVSLIAASFDALSTSAAELDQSLVNFIEKNRKTVEKSIEEIGKKAVKSKKASLSVTESRIKKACNFMLPKGIPQERFYGAEILLIFDDPFTEIIGFSSPGEEYHRILRP